MHAAETSVVNGVRLMWFCRVRHERKRHKLRASVRDATSIAQEAALKEIGFDFAPREHSWNENFALLRDLVAKQGPLNSKLPNRGKYSGLRRWAYQQMQMNREGRSRWQPNDRFVDFLVPGLSEACLCHILCINVQKPRK